MEYPHSPISTPGIMDIHRVINKFLETFSQFLTEKRYKLINFAANWGNVDKKVKALRAKKKISKPYADNLRQDLDNEKSKYLRCFLSTFSTTISGEMFFMQAKSPRIQGLLP